jgi:hypothetical protein
MKRYVRLMLWLAGALVAFGAYWIWIREPIPQVRANMDRNVEFATRSWPTDWSQATVGLDEFILGIGATDPRDGIPPIDNPGYQTPLEAAGWLSDREPGVLLQLNGEVRFFPLSILNRHEIVNDEIGGVPVAVTYCPLCNSAVAFDRRVAGKVLRFGVSGLLRNSDLVMWDDDSVSLWQQITGEAVVGEYAGTVLAPIGTAIVSFGDFRLNFPRGLSLSPATGFDLAYGLNPYDDYSDRYTPAMPVIGEPDNRYLPLERVVGVTAGGVDKAYPWSLLREQRAINDVVGGVAVAVLWGSDTADALDEPLVAAGDAIGTGLALNPVVDGRVLTFFPDGSLFTDAETNSTWTIVGRAVAGPLAGTQLATVNHRNEFWFAWNAFFPHAEVYDT